MSRTYDIYLSGPIEESSSPERWREDIMSAWGSDSMEFINPLEVNPDADDIAKKHIGRLSTADGVLVHYEQGTESWQPMAEMMLARSRDIPVVVWTGRYDGPIDQLDPFLLFYADAVHKNGRDALNKMLTLL